jgi:Skp family chaperone for outer membrane proteins
MDWVSVPVPAAIIAGGVSLALGVITAAVTLRVAKRRAAVDEKLATLKGTIDADLANRRAAVDQTLAQFKGELDQVLAEQKARQEEEKLRFTKIHEIRSEIISTLYSKLVRAYNTAQFLNVLLYADRPITPEEIDPIFKACSDATATFDENRLFLPKRLEDEIDEITLAIQKPAYIYFGSIPENLDEMREWIKTFPASNIKRKLQNLASEFRELLGVEP